VRSTPADRKPQREKSQQRPSRPPRDSYDPEGREYDRSIRQLVTSRPTQIPKDVAMRVRDAARPSADELREAEATVEIVRRYWTPPS
jgi:hypothetical protein